MDQPMAARKNGTLEAKEDDKGVFIRADVSKSVWGRDGYEAIENGIIDKMSFAFDIARDGDNWFWEEIDGIEFEIREIIKFQELYDYSPVSYPAYKDTEVVARSKALAMRNRTEPEASGKDNTAVLNVLKLARENIQKIREVRKNGNKITNAKDG